VDPHSFDLGILDPEPYRDCGSGSRIMEIEQNCQKSLIACLSKRFVCMFVHLLTTYRKYIFLVKILLFVTSDQYLDPDLHWFGPWTGISIELGSLIRIRSKINEDPQNCFKHFRNCFPYSIQLVVHRVDP
jgi:hypothetical protein